MRTSPSSSPLSHPRVGIGRLPGDQRSLAAQIRAHPWLEEIEEFRSRRYAQGGTRRGVVYDFGLFAPTRTISQRCWMPERALWAAVVIRALIDALEPELTADGGNSNPRANSRIQDEARLWFFLDEDEPCSLAFALTHLELSLSASRGRVALAITDPDRGAAMYERAQRAFYGGRSSMLRTIAGMASGLPETPVVVVKKRISKAERRARIRARLRAQWCEALTEKQRLDLEVWASIKAMLEAPDAPDEATPNALVAQPAERAIRNREVEGSTPSQGSPRDASTPTTTPSVPNMWSEEAWA